MEKSLPAYSIAIRTLGKAGEKYLETLKSCALQTHKPEKIMVYLAEGFEKPKETIGVEQIVYVPKGMIAQRALRYDEIDSDYILCLDDDVRLSPDSAERLLNGLLNNGGDCIAANTFDNDTMPLSQKIIAILSGTYPHWNQNYAFRIRSNSHYSYLNNPKKDVIPTQSLAGPALLIRKEALLAVHFEEEKWLDVYGYAFGEDQLLGNKLYKNGFKVLIHYKAGIEHLSAKTSQLSTSYKSYKNKGEMRYLLMYRSCLDLKHNSMVDRLWCRVSFWLQMIPMEIFQMLRAIRHRTWYLPVAYVAGTLQGRKKVQMFKNLRKFDDCLDNAR